VEHHGTCVFVLSAEHPETGVKCLPFLDDGRELMYGSKFNVLADALLKTIKRVGKGVAIKVDDVSVATRILGRRIWRSSRLNVC
jgi:hypothetical protein